MKAALLPISKVFLPLCISPIRASLLGCVRYEVPKGVQAFGGPRAAHRASEWVGGWKSGFLWNWRWCTAPFPDMEEELQRQHWVVPQLLPMGRITEGKELPSQLGSALPSAGRRFCSSSSTAPERWSMALWRFRPSCAQAPPAQRPSTWAACLPHSSR